MDRIRNTASNLLYRQETFFMLNHLTLRARDPKISAEINRHRNTQFNKIVWPICIVLWLSALMTFSFYFT